MPAPQDVSKHYTHGNLTAAISAGVRSLGKTINSVSVDDLASVDEFHIGGRQATVDLLDQLGLSTKNHLLDVGCGLGGAARFSATRYQCRVTGIDLTDEYVETGRVLCGWVGLGDRVSLHQGSALSMPFADGAFDGAYMLHVGMNIEDKTTLCAEVSRVLRSGAMFGIYDVMRTGDGELTYPVHWAETDAASAVREPEHYKEALRAAGFVIVRERNRRDFAIAFFEQLRATAAASGGPPPLGLHILMGKTTPIKVKNMIENVSTGRVSPVELIARKA
jgi:ubiquinone/menaquinone biosynthesis C-methylase UbiE